MGGSVKREKAINLLTKILSKIVDNPNEDKFKSMNHEKIKNKFIGFQCPFMIDLLCFAGFQVVGPRLELKTDNIGTILKKNEDQKKKEIKDKILTQHHEQMGLASKGIYNVKA